MASKAWQMKFQPVARCFSFSGLVSSTTIEWVSEKFWSRSVSHVASFVCQEIKVGSKSRVEPYAPAITPRALTVSR